MSIEIANESGVDVDEAPIVDVARYALEQMGVSPLAELSILSIVYSVFYMILSPISGTPVWTLPGK